MRILLNFCNKIRLDFIFILTSFLFLVFPVSSQSGTFMDNFDDGDMVGWKPNIEAGISVVNGEMQFKGDGQLIVKIGEASWKGYSLEARVKISEFANGGWFSVRVLQSNNGDLIGYYELRLSASGTLVDLYLNNRLLESFRTVAPIEENVWYHLSVIPTEGKIRFYLDKVVIAQLSDVNLTGYIDFCSTKGTFALMDNVIVSGPNVPDTGNSGPNSFGVKTNLKSTTTWGYMKSNN